MPRRVLNIFNEQTHFIFKFCYISGAAKDLKLCSICKLLDAGIIPEHGCGKFQGQGSSVDGPGEVQLGKGLNYRKGTAGFREQTGGEIGSQRLAFSSAVRGGTQLIGMPQLEHGRAGAGPIAATPTVLSACQGIGKHLK